ncbi:MAG: EAL domain-containing protein [Chloroflexota bacterium]
MRRYLNTDEPPGELTELLAAIDVTYHESDSDREMVERSLELASKELLERYALLQEDVAARQKTELRLTETLSVLASTLESTVDGILVVSGAPEFKISTFNQRFLDIWSISKDTAESHDDDWLITSVEKQLADPQAFRESVAEIYKEPEKSSSDVVIFKDGRVIERSSVPQRIDGKAVGRVWSFTDVSDRANAIASLQQSEEKFSKAFYRSPLAIVITSIHEDRLVDVNDAFSRLVGYDRDSAIGKSSTELGLWVSEDARKEIGVLLGKQGYARDQQVQFRTKSGEILDCLMTAESIELGGLECVLSLVQDISDRIRAENRLRASEEYFRSLIENSTDVIFVLDAQAQVTYSSPSLMRVMGYGPEAVSGSNGLSLIHPDDLANILNSFSRTVQGIAEDDQAIEFRGRHADGTWRTLETMSRRITRADGDTMIVVNFRDITERKQAEETIRHMAYHDALTGLPNRDLLKDRLEQAVSQARRSEARLAVLYIDIDRLKDVNDSVGHAGGDDLLREVAARLSHISRDGDTLSRVGGDEFVLLLPQIEKVQDAVDLAARIMESLRRPATVGGQEFRATASIGLAIFPEDGNDGDTLIRNADVAMYRAKEQGRDNHQLYAASMNASISARLSLERELAQALERGQFVLYYQPVASVADQRIVSVEALIRWQHPERGLVPPDSFIPIAEESGLILAIGMWVLETACRQGAEWERMWPGFRVAVNISARQLQQPNFVSIVRDAVWASGISPDALELEVTETAAMASPERTAQALAALGSMRVISVIDDFGTGYSSLSHLKQLPVARLKIDRSFTEGVTTDANDAAIASATIAMAHSLKLKVTAEGVETVEQLAFYRTHGCDEFQGYLLSKPCPADQLTELVCSNNRLTQSELVTGIKL